MKAARYLRMAARLWGGKNRAEELLGQGAAARERGYFMFTQASGWLGEGTDLEYSEFLHVGADHRSMRLEARYGDDPYPACREAARSLAHAGLHVMQQTADVIRWVDEQTKSWQGEEEAEHIERRIEEISESPILQPFDPTLISSETLDHLWERAIRRMCASLAYGRYVLRITHRQIEGSLAIDMTEEERREIEKKDAHKQASHAALLASIASMDISQEKTLAVTEGDMFPSPEFPNTARDSFKFSEKGLGAALGILQTLEDWYMKGILPASRVENLQKTLILPSPPLDISD